jgi:hypothetical protein
LRFGSRKMRREMHPDFRGDDELFLVGFHRGVKLVSLLRGMLSVTHQCYWRLKGHVMLSQLALH